MAKSKAAIKREEPTVVLEDSEEEEEVSKETIAKDVDRVVIIKGVLYADVETTIEEVIDYLQETEKPKVVWDKDNLPDLSAAAVGKLPYAVGKGYYAAKKQRDAETERSIVNAQDLGILSGTANSRLAVRKRPGYHQTWKRPDEIEVAKTYGYVVVRKQKVVGKGEDGTPEYEDKRPGYERGALLTIKGPDGPELVAMEIRQDVYDKHLKAVSMKSQSAYRNNKANVAESVEQFNRKTKRSNDRLIVVDDEHDVDG